MKMTKWQILEMDGVPYLVFVQNKNAPQEDPQKLSESVKNVQDQNPAKFNYGILPGPLMATTAEKLKATDPISAQSDSSLKPSSDNSINTLNDLDDSNQNYDSDQWEEFEPNSLVEKHVNEDPLSDSIEEAFKCKVCSKKFSTILGFKKHVAWIHRRRVYFRENDTYFCTLCNFATDSREHLKPHYQSKHDVSKDVDTSDHQEYPCQICDFICRSKHSLQGHMLRKHTEKYDYSCDNCDKKFKIRGDLTNHIRFYHKEKPVRCNVCHRLCSNSSSLYVHQKWAHFKPKYECEICKRRMVTKDNLERHMKFQHEIKKEKIMCSECGKTFTKNDSYRRHLAVHTGNKPHACIICGRNFARDSQLRQHMLIHTGKRVFVCDICGKDFTQKPGLICHRKTHPGVHPRLPVMRIDKIIKDFTQEYLKKQGASDDDEDST